MYPQSEKKLATSGPSCRKAFVHRINGLRGNKQSYLVGSPFAAMPGWDFLRDLIESLLIGGCGYNPISA